MPAIPAPRSSSELVARLGDTALTGDVISATRGRETVREGDAVKGREYERHLDPVLISAPQGQTVFDGSRRVALTDVTPEGDQEGVVYPNAQPEVNNIPLQSREWDHTAELQAAQRAQMLGMMPFAGGFGGGAHMMLPTQCMVHIDNFLNPNAARVSGFTPFTTAQQRADAITNPIRRNAAQKMARLEARTASNWQEFERMANVAKAPDIRAHLVPNGIIDRIENMTFEMQVEWEAKEFEAFLEAAVVAAYEDEVATTGGATTTTTTPQVRENDREVIHKTVNAVQAIEKRALKIAKANGDKSALIEGLWDAETIKARAELEEALNNRNLSEKVREYADATLEVMGEMATYAKENPAQVALEIAYMLIPFADAAKTAVFGVGDVIRGNANLGQVVLATARSAGTEFAMAGITGKCVKTGGKVIAAVGNKVASKVYTSEFKSLSGKISETPISWTAPTGTGQTYQVWQRTDINWNMVRTAGDRRFIGKTNREAAQSSLGLPPQLADGNFATLHHINQNGLGNLVEASTRYHGVSKPGQDVLHSLYGRSKSHPANPIDRLLFEQDKKAYWKIRAGE